MTTASSASTGALAAKDWESIRREFDLDFNYAHFAGFLLACHPRSVSADIEHHRQQLQRNPALYLRDTEAREDAVRDSAARYLGVQRAQIALTGSTTMGLGLVYNGLALKPGQEVLTSIHDHYATQEALEFRATQDNVVVNTIKLFEKVHTVTAEEIIQNLTRNITDKTRLIALTWVHSGSGLKMPIARIGKLIQELNHTRDEAHQILFCVDGVHGFGVENSSFAELNCDYFIAGTHKWIFGPRGTGIICARSADIDKQPLTPTVASFSSYDSFGQAMTPGGYHAFEHQWAVRRAFEFHEHIGKAAVTERIHTLNSYLKAKLRDLKQIELVTPDSTELSAGFTFFRVTGKDPESIMENMLQQRVIVSAADRDVGPVVRMAPGLLNNESEIDKVVDLLARAS